MNRALAFLIEHASVLRALGKRVALKTKQLQPKASNRQIAKTLGVNPSTIDDDVRAGNPAAAKKNNSKHSEAKSSGAGNPAPALSGAAAKLIALATCDGFTLYERRGCSTAQWHSLKLVRHPRKAGEQNCWFLGWNGERLARSTDAGKLAERLPGIERWVIDVLRAAVEAERAKEEAT
jgi:hypothetical protein